MSDQQVSAPVAPPAPEVSTEQTNATPVLDTAAAPEAKPLTPIEKKLIKELKLKIDGKEVIESLPFEVSEEHADYLTKQLQLAKMSHKRANESSDLKKTFKQFIEELRTNPRGVLSDPSIGIDVKKFAQEFLNQEAEQAKKSPEQLELEALRAEIKAARDEKEESSKKALEEKRQLMEQQEAERYDKSFGDALASANLPKSPYVIKKMADYMIEATKLGKNISPNDIVPLVRQEIEQDLADMFRTSPDEVVEKFIGKERLNGFRKKAVNKAKEQPVSLKNSIVDVGGKKPEPVLGEKKTFKHKYGKY